LIHFYKRSENDRIVPVGSKSFYGIKSDPVDPSLGSRSANKPTETKMGSVVYACTKLVIGQLYPAYASFKAVKNRNVKEYVKWMIYWIVFSTYTVIEEIADVLAYWLPLYYEIKILILFWLVSPTTRGSSVLYRGLIHPMLVNHEEDIDQYLTDMIDKTYSLSVRYARLAAQKVTKAMIETAIKGGGGIVTTLKRSVSMNDLSQSEDEEVIYKGRRQGGKNQRALMTMSWHEAQTENSSSIFDPDSDYSPQPPRARRGGAGGERSGATLVELKTSSLHSSMDTRQYQNALVAKRHHRTRDMDNYSEISSSSEKLYSTLPRVKTTRSHTRRQDVGFKPYKTTVSGRLSATPQLGLDKSRHSAKKQPAPKPPVGSTGGYKPALSKSPSKEEDFSMSYSAENSEDKKNCNIT